MAKTACKVVATGLVAVGLAATEPAAFGASAKCGVASASPQPRSGWGRGAACVRPASGWRRSPPTRTRRRRARRRRGIAVARARTRRHAGWPLQTCATSRRRDSRGRSSRRASFDADRRAACCVTQVCFFLADHFDPYRVPGRSRKGTITRNQRRIDRFGECHVHRIVRREVVPRSSQARPRK